MDLVDVLVTSLNGKNSLDDGVTISVEVVSKVTIMGVWVEAVQNGCATNGRCGFVGFGFIDHVARCTTSDAFAIRVDAVEI